MSLLSYPHYFYHHHYLSNFVLKGLFVLFILIILVLELHAIKVFGTGINMFAKRLFLLVPGFEAVERK